MKKILFYLAAAIIAGTAMTSCLGSSDNETTSYYHTITTTERAAIIKDIRQHYTGYVKYVNDSAKIDSLQSTLAFNSDSTAMLDFPVSILANYLNDKSLVESREILRKAPNAYIECVASVPTQVLNNNWTENYVNKLYPDILFYPKNLTTTFTVDGRNFQVTFANNYIIYDWNYFYPYFQYLVKKTYAYLLLKSIKADNGQELAINKPVEFKGNVD